MPRRRLAVALVIPAPLATEIDGLRRALGAPTDHVAPHITLVPPVNVRVEEVPVALAVLRGAAASISAPLALSLGPVATFHPVNPVLYLSVGGPDATQLAPLREQLLVAPLARRIDLPFVAHATLADAHPPDRIEAALDALSAFEAPVSIDSVQLLDDDAAGSHRWNPVAEARLGPRVVVGRGGWELEVSATTLADPEVAPMLGELPVPPDGARPTVVVGRNDGSVVAAIAGWVRDGDVHVERQAGDLEVAAMLERHAV
jgi:2'-5' RNA ligase